MERALGLGGVFVRSRDPAALARWYAEHLGVPDGLHGEAVWQPEPGPTLFAPFAQDTEKFGERATGWMLNFRVADLDAMLAQLRTAGVDVEPEVQDEPGVGRFGWVRDLEGNRVELWEPDRAAFG
jgi:catechol 2,3-dioxygenase-like lactoylglutathione lyase family enzyme